MSIQDTNNIQIINALDFPKPKWNASRKLFNLVSNKLPLHGDAEAKSNVFKDRYQFILQRLKRSPLFSNPREPFDVTPIDALIGSPGKKYVLGLLTQLKEGQYYLEDLKSNVPVNLDGCICGPGLFVEGCIVLAEGEYMAVDGIFRVKTLAMPLPEPRDQTKHFLGNLDLFAPIITKTTNSKYARFQTEEKMDTEISTDSEFVVLSDIHLDKPQVLDKLRILLSEYQDEPPSAILFLGNFSTAQSSYAENISALRQGFARLADTLSSFKSLMDKTHLIFVPGPTDPGGNVVNVLPLPPLPPSITVPLREKFPNAHIHFTSNPCRIRFHNQDIVVFREDLVNRMRRHCVKEPAEQDDIQEITQHLVKTLSDQGHLAPLPLPIRPVYWNYDHCQYLYPQPDTIILADRYDQYEHTYNGGLFFNPGSFATDFSFVAYNPAERKPLFSRIDE